MSDLSNNYIKEIIMSIITLSAHEAELINFEDRETKTKYPWYDTPVSGIFFIPEKDMTNINSRPTVPEKLAKMGYKIKTKIGVNGKVKGIFIKRIA